MYKGEITIFSCIYNTWNMYIKLKTNTDKGNWKTWAYQAEMRLWAWCDSTVA